VRGACGRGMSAGRLRVMSGEGQGTIKCVKMVERSRRLHVRRKLFSRLNCDIGCPVQLTDYVHQPD